MTYPVSDYMLVSPLVTYSRIFSNHTSVVGEENKPSGSIVSLYSPSTGAPFLLLLPNFPEPRGPLTAGTTSGSHQAILVKFLSPFSIISMSD